MPYTVNQLAKLSGVSVRTLHWYDEKGFLKPSYIKANGYRYYEEEQLLLLQQILFFKELGFALGDIQNLLSQSDFDKVNALNAHKKILIEDINRKNKLIETIDKTISHLRGKKIMQDEELYYGFDKNRQKEYEKYIVQECGHNAKVLLKESHKRTAKWDQDEWDNVKEAGDKIYKDLAKAINAGLKPTDDSVQAIIHKHFELQNRFYDVSKEVYIALTDLYIEHPDFKKFFDKYHVEMIAFIGKAMRYYAEKNL